MKTRVIVIFFILVSGFAVCTGCTSGVPTKSPVYTGSLNTFSLSGQYVMQGEPFTYHWYTGKRSINEIRFWVFNNNSFTIYSVPVYSYDEFSFTLSSNETKTLPPGPILLISQYPDEYGVYAVEYDNMTGEIVRINGKSRVILARVNQSRHYDFYEIRDLMETSLANAIPEGTMSTVALTVSNDWLRANANERRNFTRGELVMINGTTTIYPGLLVSCVCNEKSSFSFLPSGAMTCCSDNVRNTVDRVNSMNGSYTFSLILNSTTFEPGNYTVQIWDPHGYLEIDPVFSVSSPGK